MNDKMLGQRQVPAKIVCKCGYATYRAKAYEKKVDEYVNEYNIEPYSEETANKVKNEAGKKNKKMNKFLKLAEKDFHKISRPEEKRAGLFDLECKEEEG